MKEPVVIASLLLAAATSAVLTYGIMKHLHRNAGKESIIIISDKRCEECDPRKHEIAMRLIFPDAKIVHLDYNDGKGGELYENEQLNKLPAVLLPEKFKKISDSYKRIERFVRDGNEFVHLRKSGKFDPKSEICGNGIDDDGNELTDCDDPVCETAWPCMKKQDIPDVDLFIMSHCPSGIQMLKAILPVWSLLNDNIDFQVRFCAYAMHGEVEVYEQLRQFCIQDIDEKQYRKYLECFLKTGKSNECLKEAKIDKNKLAQCVKTCDENFRIMEEFSNKSKWKGSYPEFAINKDLAAKYNVKASPTLLVNGSMVKTSRNPQALLDKICEGFVIMPDVCEQKLDTAVPAPGFGTGNADGNVNDDAQCGH